MGTHSSILAWRILWGEGPGGLLSIGSHRVGHDWSDLACMCALEKEMATHSNILSWRLPGVEEPGGLPSMGSHRVGHNWSNLAAADHLLEWVKPVVMVPGNIQIHDILWSLEMPRILLFLWFCCYFFLQMLSYTSMFPKNPICGPKPVMIFAACKQKVWIESLSKLPENHPPFAALFDPQKA